MASLASINVKFNVDLSDFSKQMQNSLRSIDKWGQKLQSVGRNLSVAVTLPVVAAGIAAKNMASDYEESVNKVETAFKTASPAVKEFAKTTLETSGVAEATALDMSANFGDMATSMGLPVTAAAKMSTSMVALAGDLASFKNIGIEQANTALNGIFTGETESLKMLGVVMTEANLQQYAYSQGIKEKVKDLDQASKVQLRYNYILSVTKNAQGDFTRTQAGAANQDRIFSEGLKQIAQQLGSIILPLFTKVITSINSGIKSFSNLSEGSKKVIVVVAGLAAAIGPLLFGLGAVLAVVPSIVAGFIAVKTAILALSAGTLATPFGLIIAAVATLVVSLNLISLGSKNASNGLINLASTTDIANKTAKEAANGVSKFRASIEPLIAVLKSENTSLAVRKLAYDDLIKKSPEFIGTVDAEYRATNRLNVVYKKLIENLHQKLKAEANQAVVKKYYDDQAKAVNAAYEAQLKYNTLKKQYQSLSSYDKRYTVEAKDLYKELTQATDEYRTALINEKIANQNVVNVEKFRSSELDKLTAKLSTLKKGSQEYADIQNKIDLLVGASVQEVADLGTSYTGLGKGINEVLKPGTIAFYQAQITALKKQQEEVALTSKAYKKYGDDIVAVQKKIDKISTENKDFTFSFKTDFSVDNKIDNKIKAPDVSKIDFSKGVQDAGYNVEDLTSKMEYLQEVGNLVSASLSSTFSSLSSSIVQSMGLASDGFEGFAGKIIETGFLLISNLIQQAVKNIAIRQAESTANAVAGATASGAASGPLAVFTTPTFIATAIGGVLAAFAAIPKFETGGIVGGNSMYGDKILARVNSKELIANTDQQRAIWGAMNASSGGIVTIIPEIKMKGSDMIIWFNRAMERKNRIG